MLEGLIPNALTTPADIIGKDRPRLVPAPDKTAKINIRSSAKRINLSKLVLFLLYKIDENLNDVSLSRVTAKANAIAGSVYIAQPVIPQWKIL